MSGAPDTVGKLVDRFERNREAYRSGRYNETQVRVELIDRLVYELYGLTDEEIASVGERRSSS